MSDLFAIRWQDDGLVLLDQTLLPGETVHLRISECRELVEQHASASPREFDRPPVMVAIL